MPWMPVLDGDLAEEARTAVRAPGRARTAWCYVDDTQVDQAAPDFIDGVSGVALALLAGLGHDEPGWDRLLLCDLPPLQP